ncbi:MAG: hypothetical protein KF749_04280 [Bacteroidetes bacterium]|nr:hypothetical protein [Bacteroidota bacterium]MCW5897594.1 hypothetical protein [Bacteroidota bacterium]
MCLLIEIVLPDVSRQVGGQITKQAKEKSLLGLLAARTEKSEQLCGFHVSSSLESNCSCKLLADGADWKNEFWTFDAQYLDVLARTLEFLFQCSSGKMCVRAYWNGKPNEKWAHIKDVSLNLIDFLTVVRSNSVSTHSRYQVSPTHKKLNQ